jgi:hemerythrin-like domain-containing protein
VTATIASIGLPAGASAGFDTPFEMLEACHERVHRMLDLIDRLSRHLTQQGVDTEACQAARDVMRYFDQAGPAHHEDEERHVLPRLRAAARHDLADRLHADHEQMAMAWQRVRADLVALTEGAWDAAAQPDADRRWQAFAALYQVHIRVEEDEAYPAARTGLEAEAEQAMGREMAARRGVTVS